ncbi:uncharacterized protein LOC9646126 [Selaginella moellendorffii]|uniref:uncharacterized protein LOC9646126 n=1 Tax=Selaginella moellendorffii TaxID=88036 RepID=UPI000D1CB144|nr:uncharacterized protein LOC9646126 [Selaginella moellendorffii]|eukprot:XP_024522352.1 uncharacterized protein LOC9646126 [Selaginella moellendorffii]
MAAANDRQQEAAEKGVICLFRIAYAIAQGFVPLRKYPLLLELQQLNGVYVPSMYKNVMACSHFITFINKDWGLDMSRFVGFGSDGCNVMTGNRTRVAARLKEVNPFMTSTHCLSHRANLCVEDVYKNPVVHNLCDEVDQVVNKVASFFSRSSSRLQQLQALQDELDFKVLKVLRIQQTRWLSRGGAITRMCECLEPLLKFFKDGRTTQTRKLYDRLRSFKFLYALHFLGDILAVVNQLNLEFQAQTMDVTSVAPLCKATMAKIQVYYLDKQVDLNGFQLDSRGYPIIPDGGRRNGPLDELRSSVKGNEYRDVEMIRSIHGEDLEEVLEFQKNFGTSLLEGIRTRLQDSEATGILSKFHFLAPINLPSSVRELKAFGKFEVQELGKFYTGMINEAELAEEYSLWKIIASEEWKGKTFVDVWGMIYAHSIWTKKYPNLLKLAMVGMVQCCNTASYERGFSRINLVKNKFRNQMGTEMVDELVRISIEGLPIAEFDFEIMVQAWKEGAAYRHIYTS